MVRLQVTRRHDTEAALGFVERAHARQLIDSLAGAPANSLDVEALRSSLPEGLALVYYVPLEDRLFAWLLSREGSHFIERSLPAAELSRLVAAHLAAIAGRASPDVMRQTASRLHHELVLPFIPFLAAQRALVFVPDGVLQTVPFASLWNPRTAHYLVEDYLLAVAPSGTVFAKASQMLSASHRLDPRALVVGNPRIDRRVWGRLADLPGAEAEATQTSLASTLLRTCSQAPRRRGHLSGRRS
jgi:CHAT domain-containing protein